MTVLNDASAIYLNRRPADRVYVGDQQVWPEPHWTDQFGDLYGEYDMSNAASITALAGAVSSIAATWGPGLPLNQADATKQPRIDIRTQNGLPVLDIDDSVAPALMQTVISDYIVPALKPVTIALVAAWDRLPTSSSYGVILGDDAEFLTYSYSNEWQVYDGGYEAKFAPIDFVPHVFVLYYAERYGINELWIDGVQKDVGDGGAGSSSFRWISLGTGNGYYAMKGMVAHAVFFRGKANDFVGLSAHLKAQWGTP